MPRMGARESSQDVLAGHHSRNRICISSFTGSRPLAPVYLCLVVASCIYEILSYLFFF